MGKQSWIVKLAGLRFFMEGCETYFVAPTAWYYIKSLGQTKIFLAIVLSSYNFTTVIAGPITGLITDRFGRPKLIFICCCAMKIFAYLIYSINLSAYFPLLGRLMSGLSNGSLAILLGQVALQTDEESRSGTFVLLEGMFCFGSAFGPGIASFLTFNVNIFGWEINEGNSPGILMAITWFLFFLVSVVLPNDMWVESRQAKDKEQLPSTSDSDEHLISTKSHTNGGRELRERSSEGKPSILRDSRILCLYFLIFCSEMFSSTATFYVPVLGLDHFHLQLIHIKLLFLNCTIFTVFVFLALYVASDYLDERNIFLIAIFIQISAISFLMVLAFSWDQETESQYYFLLIYVCLGMPYFGYPFGNSLLSKITDPKNAAFVHGLALATLHGAIVVSRVAVSFVFTKVSLICYGFTMVVFWLVATVWYGVVYKRLVPDNQRFKQIQ